MHHANADRRGVVHERTRCRHSNTIGHRAAAAVRADDDRYAHANADCDADTGHTVTAASVRITPL